jgi:hypothetical protein
MKVIQSLLIRGAFLANEEADLERPFPDHSYPRRACYFLIDVDNLDADANIAHSCLSITSPLETLLRSHINPV